MNEAGMSVSHFRGLIQDTVVQMEGLCSAWERKLSVGTTSDENLCGQIRLVVGQARILTNERGRLTQFKNLVDNCEYGRGEKETTLLDLQGFWEMVYVQISGILDKFHYLENMERGDISYNDPCNVATVAKKMSSHSISRRPRLTKAVSNRDLKAFKAARKREINRQNTSQSNDLVLEVSPATPSKVESKLSISSGIVSPSFKSFQGGFFNIKSPMRPSSPPQSPKQRRQRFDSSKSNEFLRQAVLSTSTKASCPKSPFMVMKISSLGKNDMASAASVKQRLFLDEPK